MTGVLRSCQKFLIYEISVGQVDVVDTAFEALLPLYTHVSQPA